MYNNNDRAAQIAVEETAINELQAAAERAAAEIGIDLYCSYIDLQNGYVDGCDYKTGTRVIYAAAHGIIYNGPDEISPEDEGRVNAVIFAAA